MIKYKLIFSILFSILVLGSSFTANAEKHSQLRKNVYMSVKCHVEYRGGGEDIRFIIGQYKKANEAKGILQGRIVVKNNATVKKTILKVKECVKEEEQFQNPHARNLDMLVVM